MQDYEQAVFERGWQKLKEVDDQAGEKVVAALAEVAPDLARLVVSFGFGQVYSRPGLSLGQRELATVAMLAALGHATPQLKVHIEAALNVGLSRQEIIETITQSALYAGFPAALNAAFAAKEVFASYQPPARPLAPMAVARAFVVALQQGLSPLPLLAERIEWRIPGDPALVPWAGERQGQAAVATCLAHMATAGELLGLQVERWFETEQEVLARGHFGGRYPHEQAGQRDFVMAFDIRDGLIQRYRIHADSGAMAKAAKPDQT